jgi:hypothetical protein
MLLKMPTEKGILSLRGNVLVAYTCEKEGYAIVEDLELSIRMQQSIADAKKIPLADLEIPSKEASRAAAKSKETKEVELVPGDKTKMAHLPNQLSCAYFLQVGSFRLAPLHIIPGSAPDQSWLPPTNHGYHQQTMG